MPNYDEIIQQSQVNVKSLSEKLKDLDKLHQDIKALIKQPEIFDAKFQEIVKLTREYTDTLGTATKQYLDGNNTLFVSKLQELSGKSKEFQGKIDEFKGEIQRLEKVDLELHFSKHQKTLSDIFGAVNSINLLLTGISQAQAEFAPKLSVLQETIITSKKETIEASEKLSEKVSDHLTGQDTEARKREQHFKEEVRQLNEHIIEIQKKIKFGQIILVVGLAALSALTLFMIYKL